MKMLLLCSWKTKPSRGSGTPLPSQRPLFSGTERGQCCSLLPLPLPLCASRLLCSLPKEEPPFCVWGLAWVCWGVCAIVQFVPNTRCTMKQMSFVVFTAFLRLAVPENRWDKQRELHGTGAFFTRPPSSPWSRFGFYSRSKMIFVLLLRGRKRKKKDQNHRVRRHLLHSVHRGLTS